MPIYWKCQLIGWMTYSISLYLFGLAAKIDHIALMVATIQYTLMGIMLTHLMKRILLKMSALRKSFRIQVVYFFSVTLLFSILTAILFRLIELGLNLYELNVDMDEKSIFFVRTLFSFSTFLIWNLIYFTYHYIEKSRKEQIDKIRLENELRIQKLESEKQLAELEMQALRAQMNPHFIFNSLNAINRFILQNNKILASEYLTKFSRLIRLILQNSQEALIPLESELHALQLYLEMESLRFDDQFEYKIQVNDDIDVSMVKVPPLFIQPYAENAIWHGLMHKQEKGHLEIEVSREANMLCCRLTDDGIGRKKAGELKSKSAYSYKSMGMRITADRIAMLQQQSQVKSSIQVTDPMLPNGAVGGTEVLIKMPLHYD